MSTFMKGASSSCEKTAALAGIMLGTKVPGRTPGERRDNALALLGGRRELRQAGQVYRLARQMGIGYEEAGRAVRRMQRRLRGTRFEGSFRAALFFWEFSERRRRRR